MMRSVLTAAAIAAATLVTSACASTGTGADTAFDPSASEFAGWVRVTGGEFQLYEHQSQLNEPFARPCVSGALPRNAQNAAGDLTGTKAVVTGRAVAWSERDGAETQRHEGSLITNSCRGDYVILADSVRVLR